MKYIFSFLIFLFVVTGCSSNDGGSNHSKKSKNSLLTLEAFVVAKHDLEGRKKILLALDIENTELQSKLETIVDQNAEDILRANKFDLHWLDVRNISAEEFDFDAMKIGSKIRFVAENEQLDTHPPTSIAKAVNIMN
ncbi:hypothetical protein [Paenibacillus sp. Leaf72]|uniref:hypothetical protein n=1 Tax=Paenibacillus sp. Leaf72 TaxID=1736234 RepID=UPI0006F786B7|nr:hypothetical protein [Paenibacillus sp. Leaf72]KQO18615.1 hypothetical protein ASF12_08475 [Paenibacillus sp. Leaf72]